MKPAFDHVAEDYVRYRVGYSTEAIDTLVQGAHGGTVLDVATGTGLLADQLRPRVRRVVGVDIAYEMLQLAHPPIVQGQAEQLPFRARSFDAVTCAQAFHWLGKAGTLREFHRVVRPGGVLAFLWKYPHPDEPYDPLAREVLRDMVGVTTTPPGVGEVPELREASVLRFTWEIEWTVERYVGFMRSRESIRQRAGEKHAAWIAEFRRRLAALVGEGSFHERNVDVLYLMIA